MRYREDVYEAQLALHRLGMFPYKCDGLNGKHTKAAISAFQKHCGLKCDGILGAGTKMVLKSRLREALLREREEAVAQ